MTAAPAARLRMTQEEYLAWEEGQEQKHEFYDGEVFAMAGGTEPHARLISNLHFALRSALRGRGCTVYTDALRVHVEAVGLYTYPDLSVVCGEPQFRDARRTSLVNPTVLVEVLSPSAERYDRTTKRQFYEALPSLQAYVLVAQAYRGVDVLTRAEEGWRLTSEADGRVTIPPLGVTLDLEEVYEGVAFNAGEPPREAPRATL